MSDEATSTEAKGGEAPASGPVPGEARVTVDPPKKDMAELIRKAGIFSRLKGGGGEIGAPKAADASADAGTEAKPKDETGSAANEPGKAGTKRARKTRGESRVEAAAAEGSKAANEGADDDDDPAAGDEGTKPDTAETKPDDEPSDEDKQKAEAEEERKKRRQSAAERAQRAEFKRRERTIAKRSRDLDEREQSIIDGASDIKRSRELLQSDPLKWAEAHDVDVSELVAAAIEKRANSEAESASAASVLDELKQNKELLTKDPEKFLGLLTKALESRPAAKPQIDPAMRKELEDLKAWRQDRERKDAENAEIEKNARERIAREKADMVARIIDVHDEIDPDAYPLLATLDAELVAERAYRHAVKVWNRDKKNLSVEEIFDALEEKQRRLAPTSPRTRPAKSGGGTARAKNGKADDAAAGGKPVPLVTRTNRQEPSNGVGNRDRLERGLGGLYRQMMNAN